MFEFGDLKIAERNKLMFLYLNTAKELLKAGEYSHALKYYEKCFQIAKQRLLRRNSRHDLRLFIGVIDKLIILCKEAKDHNKQ